MGINISEVKGGTALFSCSSVHQRNSKLLQNRKLIPKLQGSRGSRLQANAKKSPGLVREIRKQETFIYVFIDKDVMWWMSKWGELRRRRKPRQFPCKLFSLALSCCWHCQVLRPIRLLLTNRHIDGMPGTILLACGMSLFFLFFNHFALMTLHPLVHPSGNCCLTSCWYTFPPS